MILGGPGQAAKSWVAIGSNQHCGTGLSKTQLLFNKAVPASAYKPASRVGPPAPIVIEKFRTNGEEQQDEDSTRSSMSFSALSEERLLAAVRLAKRDLRRRRQESLINSPIRPQQPENYPPKNSTDDLPQQRMDTGRTKASVSKEEVTRSGASVLVYTPHKLSGPPWPEQGLSPPTKDPGPGQTNTSPEPKLSQEIRRLQKELAIYIQKIEQLASRGGSLEKPLEPEEQRRVEVRRQEQAARSARIIYVLQQQVKEIQADIDKLRSPKIHHTKKSRAMDRLAAAHRGAVRAMQVFTSQLSAPSEGRVPSHYKELGQLIRQLSLCSAKVEVGQGSAVPETALDILQKLETLDSALSKQHSPRRRPARGRSSSPARWGSPHRTSSPPRATRGPATRGPATRGPATRGLQGARRAVGPKRSFSGRRVPQPPRSSQAAPLDRSQVLRAGLESLVLQRELRDGGQPGGQLRDVGFQQPTVASRLRVSQLPQKEPSVPWIPTSPHSPPRQRPPHRRPEPRCLFSPGMPPAAPSELPASPPPGPPPPCPPPPGPPEQQGIMGGAQVTSEQGLSPDKKRQAQSEALRQAWLDKMTRQRLMELDRLSQQAVRRIHRMRCDVGSSTHWAERGDQETGGRLATLSGQAQAVESTEQVSQALLEELLDEAARAAWTAQTDRLAEGTAQTDRLAEGPAQRRLQAPTLKDMLLRMEEMERDQEAVRRRFNTISYSDPYYSDREEATGTKPPAPGSRTVSPRTVSPRTVSPRSTRPPRPTLRHSPTADIILEKPNEMGRTLQPEAGFTEERPPEERPPEDMASGGRLAVAGGSQGGTPGGTRVSVPGSLLSSILRYREDHEAYLRLVAHEAVGTFNPWAIADSLAEELMSEALADVAAEFQDVCEEYAEAVFTSEFLQPILSPPATVPPLDSQ
ncbi:protein moonraker isoform X3 [Hypomesus transpacificus]|uniref:protein moonraker isoform X3 n=1 Tax=Hypomesus transpacificus TaxID=137520 RepID=UPI001F081ED6|nr:protein moonraker isoform X3 [Hypomesus transpacificus]